MKRSLVLFTFLIGFCLSALAQTDLRGNPGSFETRAFKFKTHTNFTSSTADTTGFIKVSDPILGADFLIYNRVYLIAVASDSAVADVYCIGRNGTLTTVTSTYADSIKFTAAGNKVITLEAPATDRLPGMTQLRLGVVYRGGGVQSTKANRTVKWYVSTFRN